MAYTPYNQALPDTTLYERLQGNYTPIRGRENPYDSSLFNTEYYKDPFGYTKKKLGFGPTLDDTLKKEGPQLNMGGMFAPQASSGGDSGNQENQRNYYVEREAELRASGLPEAEVQATLRAEQEANNARIAAGLTLFSNALIPGMGAMGLAKYGPEGYMDYLQGNTRVMAGDNTGWVNPTPFGLREEGKPAKVTNAAYLYELEKQSAANRSMAQAAADILARQAQEEQLVDKYREIAGFQDNGQYLSSYGTFNDSSSFSPETTAGLSAAQSSYGYGSNADYYGD